MSLNYVSPTPSEFSPRFQTPELQRYYGELNPIPTQEIIDTLIRERNRDRRDAQNFYYALHESTKAAINRHPVGPKLVKGLHLAV